MSKKLIAGAGVVASLAVALAPLATFAADPRGENGYTSDEHTDHFAVTVKDTCAFGHLAVGSGSDLVGVSHNTNPASVAAATPTAQAYWTEDATQGVVRNTGRTPDREGGTAYTETDTAAYAIEAGTTQAGFATTTLTVYCNNSTDAQYTLKVRMYDLEKGTETIPASTSYSASTSGYAMDSVVAGSGAHGAVETAFANKTAYKSETVMATSTNGTQTTGDAFTVTYGIGVASGQEAGLYEGNVVYTLYQGVAVPSGD